MPRSGDLARAVEGWWPAPTETEDRVDAGVVAAFSTLLDLDAPAAGEGDPLPPLWHWFAFLERPRTADLGDDGHPADGHFLPPVPARRRMIAGGRLVLHRPWPVGAAVVRRSELASVQVKSGRSGEMVFVTVRHTFTSDDRPLATEEQDVVYRSQEPGVARSVGAPTPREDPEPAHRFSLAAEPGPVELFRFSALTWNSRRIHYDEPYATGVEGYPGLVVHGPLLAMLVLEVPRRHAGRPVSGFDYRLRRPVFAGQRVVAGATPADDGSWTASAAVPGAPDAVTARLRWDGTRAPTPR